MGHVSTTRLVVVLAALLAVAAAVFASWRAPDALAVSGYTQTATGPLGAADRDLLDKVKQAGLWEMPAGDDLVARASDPKVREVGAKISKEHHELDHLVNDAAASLGHTLPERASVEQEAWVTQIADDPDPDVLAVNLLRQAHGKVLPLLASVKVGTRNDTVRKLATEGMVFVGRHIAYLESTGLVDYAALPESPTPTPAVSPVKASYYYAADRPTLAAAVAVLALLTTVLVARSLRRRPAPSAHRLDAEASRPRHTRRNR